MNKKILAAVVCAASVLSLAGCGEKGTSSTAGNSNAGNSTPTSNNTDSSTPDNTSTPPESVPAVELTDDDKTLSIGVWGDNGDINHLIEFFKEKTGTDVEVTAVNAGKGGEDARDKYPDLIKDSSVDLDLIICDADWVRNYVTSGDMMALADLGIGTADFGDSYQYVVGVGIDDSGVLKGASFQATPGAWFYDANLAEQYLGVKTPEEMQAKVKDWDTFVATAKELNEKSSGACALTATEGGLWQVYQCNRTKPWVVDGKLEMDTALDFYDIAKDFYEANAITDTTQWGDNWYAYLQSGKALGEFAPTWGLTGSTGSILGDAAGESRRDDNAVYSLVAGPQAWYWGGSWFLVPNKCNTKKTAAEWIKFYTVNADSMKGYSEKYGDFMSNKKVMDEIVSAGTTKNPSLKGGQDHFQVLASSVGKIDMEGKLTTYDSKIKGLFNDSVQAYMVGDMDKDGAIESFKNEVRAAFPDLIVE